MDGRRVPGELQRAHREPDRMAGKGRGTAAPGGRRNRPGIKWRRAQRELASTLRARSQVPRESRGEIAFHLSAFLKIAAVVALLALAAPVLAAERVLAS